MSKKKTLTTVKKLPHKHKWDVDVHSEQGYCYCEDNHHTCVSYFVKATCNCGKVLDAGEINTILNSFDVESILDIPTYNIFP